MATTLSPMQLSSYLRQGEEAPTEGSLNLLQRHAPMPRKRSLQEEVEEELAAQEEYKREGFASAPAPPGLTGQEQVAVPGVVSRTLEQAKSIGSSTLEQIGRGMSEPSTRAYLHGEVEGTLGVGETALTVATGMVGMGSGMATFVAKAVADLGKSSGPNY